MSVSWRSRVSFKMARTAFATRVHYRSLLLLGLLHAIVFLGDCLFLLRTPGAPLTSLVLSQCTSLPRQLFRQIDRRCKLILGVSGCLVWVLGSRFWREQVWNESVVRALQDDGMVGPVGDRLRLAPCQRQAVPMWDRSAYVTRSLD